MWEKAAEFSIFFYGYSDKPNWQTYFIKPQSCGNVA